MESSSLSPKLLLALLLLLLAPVLRLQARELGGGSQEQHVIGALPSAVLVLPSGGDDGEDGAVVVPPKLNELPGVSRSGGLVPPAPQPGTRPQPGQHEPLLQDVVSSPPGVTGNQKPVPPSPAGNPPGHYRHMGPAPAPAPAADLLRVFWDAIVRVLWVAA